MRPTYHIDGYPGRIDILTPQYIQLQGNQIKIQGASVPPYCHKVSVLGSDSNYNVYFSHIPITE